jgi:ArsR family transcriptional regulator, arsenate/arsenite/antimonite-responsive transcriptional repressor / arsenate reductase (thioredoxin)
VVITSSLDPPAFLEIAGHPLRWRLLSELAGRDLRVGELCRRLEVPQNLASYHLGRLRSAGFVRSRRSAHDGRDTYYTLDLARCGAMLSEAGAALHPGLRLVPSGTNAGGRRPPTGVRVLFLCTGNSARSQIAEALLEAQSEGRVTARSAGSHPKPLHPNAVAVMRKGAIDISGRTSKHLDTFLGERFDYVISLCDRVREVCPEFPGHPDTIHWSIPDPAREGGSDRASYPAFERTAQELGDRIGFLLDAIELLHPAAH